MRDPTELRGEPGGGANGARRGPGEPPARGADQGANRVRVFRLGGRQQDLSGGSRVGRPGGADARRGADEMAALHLVKDQGLLAGEDLDARRLPGGPGQCLELRPSRGGDAVGALGPRAQRDGARAQPVRTARARAGDEPPVLQRAEQAQRRRLADLELLRQLGEGPLGPLVRERAGDAERPDDGLRSADAERRRGETLFHNSANVPAPPRPVKPLDIGLTAPPHLGRVLERVPSRWWCHAVSTG